jgi:TPP-dependent pyruvate/acetoin dehydrogenase alpha subunit
MPDVSSRAAIDGDLTAASADGRFLDPAIDRLAIRPHEPVAPGDLEHWYRAMRLARTFEDKLAALYRQGRIVGAVYLGAGQEAIVTGVVSLLRTDDYFSTVARGLAGWFLRGVEPRDVFARWLGKDIPPSHGRELGLFLADLPAYGIAPYHNGSMASWIPSAAGFALAFKYRRQPRVYVALTGDGATSPGDFYEGLNFAAIHKLPLVIVVENNCYAYSTPVELQMPVKNVADRAPAFNIPAAIGFGNDIFEVRRLVGPAIEHARSGQGPCLVEFKTFRRRGHGEHDDMAYVPRDLREFWERRDPIRLFQEYLLREGGWTEAMADAVDRECSAVVERALEEAAALPDPVPESVTRRLFVD